MNTKFSGRLAAAAAMTVLALACAPSAHAAARPAGQTSTFTVPAGARGATVTVDGASVTVVRSVHASPKDATTCTVSAHNPIHGFDNTVWGGVSVTCNATSASINVVGALYYSGTGTPIATSQVTTYNSNYAGITAKAPYRSGRWRTGGVSTYFGYDGGGTATDEKYSAWVTL